MPKTKTKLTPKQERFCKLYVETEDFFGNGTKAYCQAFGTKAKPIPYNSARSLASRLLADIKIAKRVDELLESSIFSKNFADKNLGYLIAQFSDFGAKLGAIREYNRLKGRIANELPEGILPFHITVSPMSPAEEGMHDKEETPTQN